MRVIVGLALLGAMFLGAIGSWGRIGAVPVVTAAVAIGASVKHGAMNPTEFAEQRLEMVRTQVSARGVRATSVLNALRRGAVRG
jgi:hypothetical protein